jgi:hypothetical protein
LAASPVVKTVFMGTPTSTGSKPVLRVWSAQSAFRKKVAGPISSLKTTPPVPLHPCQPPVLSRKPQLVALLNVASMTLRKIRKETGLPNQPTKWIITILLSMSTRIRSRTSPQPSLSKKLTQTPQIVDFATEILSLCGQFPTVRLFYRNGEILPNRDCSLLLSAFPNPAITFFFPFSRLNTPIPRFGLTEGLGTTPARRKSLRTQPRPK